MRKINKIVILIITLLLLCSCGTKKEETVEVANSSQVTEVISNRSIVIVDINGTATVKRSSGEKLDAYEGMKLLDGDEVIVNEDSNLTLNIDSDKHLFAEASSHFKLSATGSENNTKTLIHLEAGSVLCDIKEKLKEDETFDIETANSTMCVRGTVFRVCLLEGNDKSSFDLVEVYDGKVWSNIDNTENNVTLEPGQCALVRKLDSSSENATYVLEEDINDNFIKETGLNITLEKAESGEKGALKLSLDNVSVETLSRLETIVEEGTKLVIEKEEITQVKEEKIEEIKKAEAKEETKPVVKQAPQKVEEPVVEEKEEEPKPAECTHPNMERRLKTEGNCCEPDVYIVYCPDCGHSAEETGSLRPDNHKGPDKTYQETTDNPCTERYRSYYKLCTACEQPHDEIWIEPHHTDDDGDGICDICKQETGW